MSELNRFDPSHLGDPIAMQTDWSPVKGGGASFRTHDLVDVYSYRLEFRASIGAKAFYLFFLLAGIVTVNVFLFKNPPSGVLDFCIYTLIPLIVGLICTILGGCMLYFCTAPIVFDKNKGAFWKGRKPPDQVIDTKVIKDFAALNQIHALQLISEYCRRGKSSYYSYELNLVLENGNRLNVIDHGNQNKLREDANTLSAFLEKPVWDAI